jgi:hypothetical protein
MLHRLNFGRLHSNPSQRPLVSQQTLTLPSVITRLSLTRADTMRQLLRHHRLYIDRLHSLAHLRPIPLLARKPFPATLPRQFSISRLKAVSEEDRKTIHIQGTGNKSIYIAFCIASLPQSPRVVLLSYTNHRLIRFHELGGKITVIEDGHTYEIDGIEMEVVPQQFFTEQPHLPANKHLMMRSYRLDFSGELVGGEPYNDTVELQDKLSKPPPTNPPPSLGTVSPIPDLRTLYQTPKRRRKPRAHSATSNKINLHVRDSKEAASLPPIMNLIVTTNSEHICESLAKLKNQLRPDSAVMFVEKGLGVLEELFRTVFKDPQTRPTCISTSMR